MDELAWIEHATLEELRDRFRNAPQGDPIFRGALGLRFIETLNRRLSEDEANVDQIH